MSTHPTRCGLERGDRYGVSFVYLVVGLREPNWPTHKTVAYGSVATEPRPEHAVLIRNKRSWGPDPADCGLGRAWAIEPRSSDPYGHGVANELPVGMGGSA